MRIKNLVSSFLIFSVLFSSQTQAATAIFDLAVTAESVQDNRIKIDEIEPSVGELVLVTDFFALFLPKGWVDKITTYFPWAAFPTFSLLTGDGPLGENGPIGPWGPLAELGPVGENPWNPSVYKKYAFLPDVKEKWNFSNDPWSEKGPLGPKGPLSKEAYYEKLPDILEPAVQLQAGGLWGILGPVGPLGALGPLGPLGEMGPYEAHGLSINKDGNFIDHKKQIVENIQVKWGSGTRSYELHETYQEEYAKGLKDNDTSFMVYGKVGKKGEEDTYLLTSREDQFVSVVVVASRVGENFRLTIQDDAGKEILRSKTQRFTEWVQLRVRKNTKFKVSIDSDGSLHFNGNYPYRLIVVGSTSHLKETSVRGPHQIKN